MKAFEIQLKDVIEQVDVLIAVPVSLADELIAERWLGKVVSRISRTHLRKGIPPDDVPSEANRISLAPKQNTLAKKYPNLI